jgi:hypothetical protein
MLSRLFRGFGPRSIYDVMAAIGCFAALATGTAYAANTVFSTDIVDGQVKSVDIGQGEVGSADVKDNSINTFDVHSFLGVDVVDGSLKDEDIGEGAFVNLTVSIGTVPAHACVDRFVYGVLAEGDHLVLTPNYEDTDALLDYTAQFTEGSGDAIALHVCNPTAAAIDDGSSHFNLLVINAR